MAETLPNVPALFPPARAKLKALLARPLIGLPALSFTSDRDQSVLPEATVGDAKLISGLRSTDPHRRPLARLAWC